eukprot:gene11421-11567_t
MKHHSQRSIAVAKYGSCEYQQHRAGNLAGWAYVYRGSPAVRKPAAALQGLQIPHANPPMADERSADCTECAAVTASARAIALDVEYSHFVLANGSQVAAAAWIAAVDGTGRLLLKTYVAAQAPAGARWSGGVNLAKCSTALPLQEVVQQLQLLLQNQLLVGHGLAKDLSALGLAHPKELQFDTMTHNAFCNKAGNAKSLKQLAQQYLNRQVQATVAAAGRRTDKKQKQSRKHQRSSSMYAQGSQELGTERFECQQHQLKQRYVHDPEEDARAVMELYQKVVWPSTYKGQVAATTERLVSEFKRRHYQSGHRIDQSGQP